MTSTDAGTRPHLPTGSGGLTLYGGPELVADAYARGSWDGVVLPYVPYIATSHLLDVAAYRPFFWDGELFCWFFNAAHSMHIGGTQPGSFCADAKDIFDEPMTWPPIRLVHDDLIQHDVYDAFLRQ